MVSKIVVTELWLRGAVGYLCCVGVLQFSVSVILIACRGAACKIVLVMNSSRKGKTERKKKNGEKNGKREKNIKLSFFSDG